MNDPNLDRDDLPDDAPAASPDVSEDARQPDDVAAVMGALQGERDALQDRLLRVAAEFDNYRKRIERERREQADAAAESLLVELLPIVDDLERALQAPASDDALPYRAGVELILRQMLELLRRRGVTAIDTAGAAFDPRVHQAVSQEKSDTHDEGQIIEEFRRGYMLGERLLRPAMVKVAAS
jgi:molecular chaperone GrpE